MPITINGKPMQTYLRRGNPNYGGAQRFGLRNLFRDNMQLGKTYRTTDLRDMAEALLGLPITSAQTWKAVSSLRKQGFLETQSVPISTIQPGSGRGRTTLITIREGAQ